jgi:hypothetical protein
MITSMSKTAALCKDFAFTPVKLTFRRDKAELVGIGSDLVNAVGSCNDCHTCPSYEPGADNNPYTGGPGEVNAENFLAGGVVFGPGLVSANLTPAHEGGLPEQGHTFRQFHSMLRTGRDADDPTHILQVMPWPVLRNMTDDDLHAIYEYLRAIPPAQPGTCDFPGQ